jgi:uncharacterized protein YdeI (YjbR/CyaY-like superfamily)
MKRQTRHKSFRTPADFRAWLARNHATESELTIRLYKVSSASKGITYLPALDEALCYGWIDGVRRSLDAESFTQRFSPRKPKSIWSRVNIAKVEALIKAGRMAEPGLARYRERDEKRTGLYSFEREAMSFSPALERQFKKAAAAWRFFQGQPPGYRRLLTFYVMSAKQEETRVKRLARLIAASVKGKRLT